ncbi:hypothetical protein [Flavobacterium sp.]|jgi:H+/Cl- antiporter ClcA|uniref:hypothetical protein n=1 Tax=Flavobacterium sp. TaxID=239 RepID=UPI002A83BA2D|nr:hypothetical protein [Flavobacterium sp.]
MSKLFYFKVTFLFVSVGLFVGNLAEGLFNIDYSNTELLLKLVLKSFVTAVLTGLLLGVLNMFFKIGDFNKKEND